MNIINILIIEDNKADSDFVQELLSESVLLPHNFEVAGTLTQGLEILGQMSIDVVLLDLNLPDSQGYDTIRTLIKKNITQPILILSGVMDEQLAIEAVREGAQDYLIKGDINIQLLERAIHHAIERHHAELKLKRAKQEWEVTFDAMSDWITLIDTNGRILRSNISSEAFIHQSPESILGKRCCSLIHDSDECIPGCPLLLVLSSEKRQTIEVEMGEQYWKIVVEPIWNEFGSIVSAVHVVSDITTQKEAELELKKSVKEKDILLNEIHHRVKNNMQVIISLLNLQTRHLDDPKIIDAFHDSQNRIQSMTLIYERLYRSKNISSVSLPDYIRSLATELYRVYGTNPDQIRLDLNCQEISLDIKQAIPLGLILNELISNSLKYAFPDQREGSIQIQLMGLENNSIELKLADTGIGNAEIQGAINQDSMGMKLVRMLTEIQLSGEYKMKMESGTTHSVRFEKEINN